MNYNFNTSAGINSTFISEDYFPAIVQFSSEELNNNFIEFKYQDSDMFELVSDSKTDEIKQFTLTLCNHFEEVNDHMHVPDAENGIMLLGKSETINCDCFVMRIYKDGLFINVSSKNASKFFKCGQLIFAFDEANTLVALYVTELSEKDISHVLREVHSNL